MRVLVLGGTRFIGAAAVRRLAALGHLVTVLHRGNTPGGLPAEVQHLHAPDVTLGDRRALPGYARRLGSIQPDVVLDMVPLGEADARAAVDVFRGLAGRLVAVGSQDVFRAYGLLHGNETGPPDPLPLTEDSPLRSKLYPYRADPPRAADDPGRWADDYDKILVERVVQGDPELPGTVLRLPAVYGPGDYQHRLQPHLRRMDDGRPAIVMGGGEAAWRWTRAYVENVAEAIALAVTDERAVGRIYNVAETQALSTREWVEAIGAAAGWSGRVVVVPDEQLPEALSSGGAPAQDLVADSSRIRAELGFAEPVAREEALVRTVAWERANLPANVPDLAEVYAAEDTLLAAGW
ncbi:MAG: NAD-dependent epimerase/dehydratase family protein [Armatimonadetes bacterium]|nr:NAD-dependent epimerase/dehydratase family protein [Armatimonadota bacterium]